MGKEVTSFVRTHNRTICSTICPFRELLKKSTVDWDVRNLATKTQIVKTNGMKITIIMGNVTKHIICNGLDFYGNKYNTLLKALRKDGVIPSGAKLKRIFIDKGYANINVDPSEELILSEDKLILIIDAKKKGIRKIRHCS